jgi:ribosomal subunit interface protein
MPQSVSGVRVSGKNLDIGQSLRGQAEERIHDAVAKYFDGGFRSKVTVEKDGTGFRAECTVHLDTGATMHVSGAAHDAYSSVSQVVERIGKQMRRDKRKRTAHTNGAHADTEFMALGRSGMNDASEQIDFEPVENGRMDSFARPIVAERVDRLDRISLESAIVHLENAKLTSYAFRNEGTDRINILHERADGSIGWIDVAER